MTAIRRKRPVMADEDPEALGSLSNLPPPPPHAGWLSGWSLLWMVPPAAALAGLVIFVIEAGGEAPGEAKPAVAEAPAHQGPATTGSFGRAPPPALPERSSADRAQPRPGLAPAAPAAPEERASDPRSTPASPESTGSLVAAAPQAPAPAEPRRLPQAAPLNLSPEEIATHLARGEERLKAGELAAARLYFERVALAGDRRGALGMARTYDPAVLAGLPILGPQADPAAARAWYDRAGSQRAGR